MQPVQSGPARAALECSVRCTGLPAQLQPGYRLRLLSFNIQVGIRTSAYHQYLTRCWKHLLPHREREGNLQAVGNLLDPYDLVALQEVDGGSLRTRHVNQVEQLALQARFPYWYQQLNRNLAPFARHSNGLLSRIPLSRLEDHPLPGPAGRRAMLLRIGQGRDAVAVVMMHLALGSRTRNLQLAYVRELLQDYRHFVLMGDLNTQPDELLNRSPLRGLALHAAQQAATFPSWKPSRCLDHILLSDTLQSQGARVLPYAVSDHLPVATELILPPSLATLQVP